MSVLTVCQRLAPTIGIEVPDAVMASTDPDALVLAGLVRECGERILEAHDWQIVKRLHTLSGDDATEAFDLPSDFYRLPKEARLWSTRLSTPLTQITSHDRWLELDIRSFDVVVGVWTLLGGQVQVKPAPATGESVKFYYQSNAIWNDGSSDIDAPMADGDTFRLDERLLRLAIIWQWKAYKNLPYAEDMANFEYALAQAVEREMPGRIVIGRRRAPRGMDIAYPQAIEP